MYNFYLHRSGPGMVMLMGFFGMIAIFLIPVAKIAAYISIAGLAVLTLIVFIDVFRMPKLVARAHANSLGGQS